MIFELWQHVLLHVSTPQNQMNPSLGHMASDRPINVQEINYQPVTYVEPYYLDTVSVEGQA